jgi:Plasmid maintenance system antidote protein
MNAEVRITPSHEGLTEISLSIPSGKARAVLDAICGILPLAGLKIRQRNEENEEIASADTVFPDGSPAMALRGFRGKMEWTQQELAEKLGTTQNCISGMESGKRSISRSMAIRLGGVFDISHKVFL